MLLAFQNCSSHHAANRSVASAKELQKFNVDQKEYSVKIDKNLKVK
jgi:hypothetical protein